MTETLFVFGLKTCDTTRKALKDIEKAGRTAQFSDLREAPLDAATRAGVLAQLGETAINRASTTWRGLSDTEKARSVSELLADHPTLYRRPLIRSGGRWFCGWRPEVQKALLG